MGNIIYVKNPRLAFSKILQNFYNKKIYSEKIEEFTPLVTNQMIVYDNGTIIYPNCFIGPGVTLGSRCIIHPNVTLVRDCVIKDNVTIHPGSVIGSDGFGYNRTSIGYEKIYHVGKVVIEDNVEIGSNTTIDRGTMDDTIIGAGTKIDNLVQIGHNVKIGKNCLVMSQVGIAGSTIIEDEAIICAKSGVKDNITIGTKAIITAMTGVQHDIPSGAVYSGVPSRPHIESLRIFSLLKKLPEMYKYYKSCCKKDKMGS